MLDYLLPFSVVAMPGVIRHRRSHGAIPPKKFLAYLVILCFEKRRPKRKYCCSPKVKHIAPKQIQGWLRHCFS